MPSIKRRLFWQLLFLIVFVDLSCLAQEVKEKAGSENTQSKGIHEKDYQDCLRYARTLLGDQTEILQMGDLNHRKKMEALIIKRIPKKKTGSGKGIYISEARILEKQDTQWKVILTIGEDIKNDEGYVGIDFLDDSFRYYGYELTLDEERGDGVPSFTIYLEYLDEYFKPYGLALEINWNPKVGRYQEYDYGQRSFRSELKNPEHINRKPNR